MIAMHAYDGDAMSARAGVPLEYDIATFVDSEAVVLVHDRAARIDMSLISRDQNSRALPILDNQVVRAAVEPVSVVSCCVATAVRVGLVTESFERASGRNVA